MPKVIKDRRVHSRPVGAKVENCNSRASDSERSMRPPSSSAGVLTGFLPSPGLERFELFASGFSGSFRHERQGVGRSIASIGRTADWSGLRMSPYVLRHMQKPNALTKKA